MKRLRGVLVTVALLSLGAPSSAGSETVPAFVQYRAPVSMRNANRAGETSIGVDRRTNAAMFLMFTTTARVTWSESGDPPRALWLDVSARTTSITTNDPFLHTDPVTGRTFVAQLAFPTGASLFAFTDDDGDTWTTSVPPLTPPSNDHEKVASGPYPYGFGPRGSYPNAVYYCASGTYAAAFMSQCARSDDGGLTWGPPVLVAASRCYGFHGRDYVASDGTLYQPQGDCAPEPGILERQQGIMMSTDAGATFTYHAVPGAVARDDVFENPAVAVDGGSRLYFVGETRGIPTAATSDDRGTTWTPLVDVGAAFGVVNTIFPHVVAGDAGRAAFSFLGSTMPGDSQSAEFDGVWHLYVAFTYDGGQTWQTVDTTPHDPVQRGCIWLRGGTNPCRNLLDFEDITTDAQGRVLVGYSDGCTSSACRGPGGTPESSRSSLGTIARQSSGKGLLAAFD
jgi:hypothetical protein